MRVEKLTVIVAVLNVIAEISGKYTVTLLNIIFPRVASLKYLIIIIISSHVSKNYRAPIQRRFLIHLTKLK